MCTSSLRLISVRHHREDELEVGTVDIALEGELAGVGTLGEGHRGIAGEEADGCCGLVPGVDELAGVHVGPAPHAYIGVAVGVIDSK